MSIFQVLLVAGTHGNEINAPWILKQWDRYPNFINDYGIKVRKELGNPKALKMSSRYIDYDLNRSFREDFFDAKSNNNYETIRAKELISTFGKSGGYPCQLAIDMHSTTSSMGNCVVIYGRRPQDLALASLLQFRLGMPIYLHESDESQKGFLVESWPCGLVIEVGPVPQGLIHSNIIRQTKLVLEVIFEELSKVRLGIARYPMQFIAHCHLGSVDFPRDSNGNQTAYIHPSIQGRDWFPLRKGDPLFITSENIEITYNGQNTVFPVFINEAAYAEKNIAMSLTKKEILPCTDSLQKALEKVVN